MKQIMTKDVIPEGFTLSLTLVDSIPVLFFCIDCMLIGKLFSSKLFILGAIICMLSGLVKVLWKAVVALRKKNIWWMFLQMRIIMPVGFVMMILALIVDHQKWSLAGFLSGFLQMPSVLFFMAGIIGMIMMIVFAAKLDSSDLKSNWIEQLTNGLAQISFMIGLLLLK